MKAKYAQSNDLEDKFILDHDLGVMRNVRFMDSFQKKKYNSKLMKKFRYDFSTLELFTFENLREYTTYVMQKQKCKMIDKTQFYSRWQPSQYQIFLVNELMKTNKYFSSMICPHNFSTLILNSKEMTKMAIWMQKHNDRIEKYKIGHKKNWENASSEEKEQKREDLKNLFLREMGH